MLTKTDLNQIRGVVRDEVEIVVEDKLKPIRKALSQIGQVIDEKLRPIKKDLKYLKTTVNLIVKNYDEADVKLERRVRKIETQIGLAS
ncbi:MAG: hypothetical protein Q7R51_01910 [bacterium]|nr:hypothetical protein [bacterium]